MQLESCTQSEQKFKGMEKHVYAMKERATCGGAMHEHENRFAAADGCRDSDTDTSQNASEMKLTSVCRPS